MTDAFLSIALLLVLVFVIAVKTSVPPVPGASVRGFIIFFSLPAAVFCVVMAGAFNLFGG